MSKQIDGISYSNMLKRAAINLRNHAGEINDLNVFPIPDGDTGDNMLLTLMGGVDALKTESPSLAEVSRNVANGMLFSARGNSGVILSLLMRTRIPFQTRTCGLQLSMSITVTSTTTVAVTSSEDMATGAMLRRRSED